MYDHDQGDSNRASTGLSFGSKGDEPDALSLRKGGTLRSVASIELMTLKTGYSNLPNLPAEVKSSILLHSKTFDPKTYLATVHPHATFKDLSVGRERLKGKSS